MGILGLRDSSAWKAKSALQAHLNVLNNQIEASNGSSLAAMTLLKLEKLAVSLTRFCGPTHQLTVHMCVVSIGPPTTSEPASCNLWWYQKLQRRESRMIYSVAYTCKGCKKAPWPNPQYNACA